ncbi:type IV pilus modification PilV family protein [Bacillus massiliigorillae]|uniref:type IV pilus modification PilV family protein n=1 Tax=Bacillus massiliigorillae TaxID=1243664 RepID=UPI0003A6AD0D|nr:type II secretion system protein [Bacillus massiliigorillae]
MKYCHNIKNCKGFTLLEVLISLGILSIILLTLMSFFSQSFQYTKNNESKTVGINVARNVLNYMESQDFAKIREQFPASASPVTLTKDHFPNDFELEGYNENIFEMKVNNVIYSATVVLSNHDETELQDYLIPVTVIIHWGDNYETSLKGVIKK